MPKRGQSKTVVFVAAAVTALLLIGGAAYLIFGASEGNSEAYAVAAVLPDNVAGVAWSTSIDDALEWAGTMKVSSETLDGMGVNYSRMVAKLGFDPLDAGALQELGLDTAGTPAVALAPAPMAEGLVVIYLPMLAEHSGIDSFVKITTTLGADALIVEKAEDHGYAVGWIYKMEADYAQTNLGSYRDEEAAASEAAQAYAPPQKRLRGALVEIGGALLLITPVDYDRWHIEEIEGELRTFVSKVVDDTTPRLATVDGFEDSVAGSGGALLGVYANSAGLRGMMAQARSLAPMAAALTDIVGFGAYIKEVDNSIVAVAQSVASGDSPKQFLRERDSKVLKLVPGEPLMGLHLAIDSELMMHELEKGFALEPRLWREYQEGKQEAQEALRLPGVEIHQLWDGEFGIFLGDLAPSKEFLVRSTVAFAGVKDADKLGTALDAVAIMSRGDMVSDAIGTSKAWRISEGSLTMGVMLHENRLWFSGDWSTLAKIEKGEHGELLEGERNEVIAAVMNEDNGFASYSDLKKPMAMAMAMGGRSDREMMALVAPLLSKLDYLTYTGRQEGRVSIATATLHLDGQTPSSAVAEAVASQFFATADKYGRRAKTAEPIDMLDRMYKGAADYYATPRVDENTASMIDCQFPEDVPLSPGNSCCADYGGPDSDGDDRCDENYLEWDKRGWYALKFQILDPHYCVYSFDSNGLTGAEAQFTANAHCDLDCDGILSTFQRYGKGDPSSSKYECAIVGAAALFTDNELE
jgi:hypothetical protein